MTRITFTPATADRIRRSVLFTERFAPPGSPLTFDSLEEGKKTFRTATFTGAWALNGTIEVRFRANTSQTALAVNLFANITASSGARPCAIAREGTSWYLIAARC